MVYFYLPVFFCCFKTHKITLHSKRVIHELWEVMNFSQLITWFGISPVEVFEPWGDWENELEKLPQVCALYFEWTFFLSGRVLFPT